MRKATEGKGGAGSSILKKKQKNSDALGNDANKDDDMSDFKIEDLSDQQLKLLRKGILPSLSLCYKKPAASLIIGNQKVRTVKREDQLDYLIKGEKRPNILNDKKKRTNRKDPA